MRWFMKLMIIAGIGWSGYWFVGAQAQEKLLANWLETSRANGWIARTDTMNVTGFPNRFDTKISGLDLRGPDGSWGWQSEGFQIYALSYQPNHIIFSWPGEQVITYQNGSVTVQGSQMRGSIQVSPTADLPLERLRVEATAMTIESSEGWDADVKAVNLAFFQDEAISTRYRFGLDLKDVSLPLENMSALVLVGQNTSLISSVLASAYVDFDQEIDSATLTEGLPGWRRVDIEEITLDWGRANLTVSGELWAAGNGYIDGNIDFQVENWKILLAAFQQMSNLRPSEMTLLEAALNGAAQGNMLDFSLRFANGKTMIGPITIGDAPVNPFF